MIEARRNELLLQYQGIARQVAAKLRTQVPRKWADDLYGWGIVAMIKALDEYKPKRSKNLVGYLTCKVRFGIFDGLREIEHSRRTVRPHFADLDAVWPEVDHHTIEEPATDVHRKILGHNAWAAIKQLPPRWAVMLLLYYGSDLTMKQCGRLLGVNEPRASQIHKQAIRRLREILGVRVAP